jgi:NAD(P)-dependent dehydrogenase (short-subunit alcohol dehydrogenase family)
VGVSRKGRCLQTYKTLERQVLPGPTESEGVGAFVNALAKQQDKSKEQVEQEFFERARPSSLLKRFAPVQEVGAMVTYLASELSSAINGAAVRVDGGVGEGDPLSHMWS